VKKKIYYHDTDCGGVVYYANYLKYLEEARTELLEERGLSISELAKQGTVFVVARQEIDYKLPTFYADILSIDIQLANISGVRIEFTYAIKNQKAQIVCIAKTVMACIDKDFKPKAIPEEIREKLTRRMMP
jgi:acyl-CoA thioester hydrolase